MFSPRQHQLRLNRAKRLYRPDNDFLLKRAMQDICERLSTVNMRFENAICLFARTPDVFNLLRDHPKIDNLKRLEEPVYLGEADHIATTEFLDLKPAEADLIIPSLLALVKRPSRQPDSNQTGPETKWLDVGQPAGTRNFDGVTAMFPASRKRDT